MSWKYSSRQQKHQRRIHLSITVTWGLSKLNDIHPQNNKVQSCITSAFKHRLRNQRALTTRLQNLLPVLFPHLQSSTLRRDESTHGTCRARDRNGLQQTRRLLFRTLGTHDESQYSRVWKTLNEIRDER